MKYTHYAPNAPVTVVCGNIDAVVAHINTLAQSSAKHVGIMATDQTIHRYDGTRTTCLSVGDRTHVATVGANLFATLRAFDEACVDVVLAEGFSHDGVGDAIMNRLEKAAGFNVVIVSN